MQLFRLVHYPRGDRHREPDEYLGSCDAIWNLWNLLNNILPRVPPDLEHESALSRLDPRPPSVVEVYNLYGARCNPEKGIEGMHDIG